MKFYPQNRPLILAHRGDTTSARENSAEAIGSARKLGADGVEIDVRVTKDGHLVLAHDPEVQGLTISSMELEIIQRSWPIDLLADGLGEATELVVDLEIKGPLESPRTAIELLKGIVEASGIERILVSSFWISILIEAQTLMPGIPLGLLTSAAFDGDGFAALDLASANGFEVILPSSASVSPQLIEQAHRAQVAVIAWTEDEPARFELLKAWGIDGVITDRPEALLALR